MPTPRILLWSGLVAAAGGAVLCVLGWYGISGERFAERQLPYLASCTVPGAALIVAGAVLLVAACALPVRPPQPRRPAASEEEPPAPSAAGPFVRVPAGTLAHRSDCPLVAGRPEAVEVGDAVLDPCPVCEPWPP
ncbi:MULTISPECIES: hypothetical protein [Streptomyces]|uniref:Uncharacterized protein n=1 Tax=Streptomyces venezuelae (strain ATCC 10712 / CBS 650.69 / DSM 40230 / JCM 4526 / NBRC 13096 / PD 04745) TaxID=953739 RepID=F2RF88_STRVP|nr:hypothetical protein [Streptomyces venezuelae]APE20740.1 hypothetical protein vnz_06765 [Streptomyces venezuelae]QER98130.1 hypothetical protein DEJ43_06825 [Streptomyces venezuelae ATCC 10712]CCA54668.1 hypothetical protein SVEN_1381 [Streptomyces venezuelae ATCC 10712]